MLEQLATMFTTMPGGAFIWSLLAFIIVVGVLVFVHEMGHYLAARSVGVHIETFSIGFGREIFGWNDKVGTRWRVAIFPLGGYVKMYGMTGEMKPHEVPEDRKHEAFVLKSVLRRMWVVFAGPFANFVFAFFVLAAMMYTVGERRAYSTAGAVVAEMPAAQAGVQAGDHITEINGYTIKYWDELVPLVREQGSSPLTVKIYRPSTDIHTYVSIKPKKVEVKNILGEAQTVYQIGIRAGDTFDRISHGFIDSAIFGVEKTYQQTSLILQALWRMITGQMGADIGGPLTIGKVAGEQATMGIESLLIFMAFISINLGLINLFPVPVLDGGHLVYFALEGILRRPITEKIQDMGNRIGMGLLIALMLFAFYKDILNVVMPFLQG